MFNIFRPRRAATPEPFEEILRVAGLLVEQVHLAAWCVRTAKSPRPAAMVRTVERADELANDLDAAIEEAIALARANRPPGGKSGN